jgi:hypothetical protein
MNQPPNVVPAKTEARELPEPGYPLLTRMISNPIFPSSPQAKDEPITWVLGKQHPFIPEMKVMRMFVVDGSVEIYSVSADGHSGIRNVIPMVCIRLIEEAMPIDVFIEELANAEDPEGDGDPDDTDDPEDPENPEEPAQPSPPTNSPQTAPS